MYCVCRCEHILIFQFESGPCHLKNPFCSNVVASLRGAVLSLRTEQNLFVINPPHHVKVGVIKGNYFCIYQQLLASFDFIHYGNIW